jgi:hypothetical protein
MKADRETPPYPEISGMAGADGSDTYGVLLCSFAGAERTGENDKITKTGRKTSR